MTNEFDIITLRGLTASGQHGVLPFEREGTQPFGVDVSLWVDTRPAAAADDIDLTVSYADIAEEAVAVLTGPSVHLLETLASRVADVALSHPRVQGVEVTVHKPMAPLRQRFSDVSVTIRRGAAAGVSGPDTTGALPLLPHLRGDHTAEEQADEADAVAGHRQPRTSGAPGRATGDPQTVTGRGREWSGEEQTAPDRTPPRRAREEVRTEEVDRSGWHDVVLALGGNVGDVPTTLARAVAELVDLEGVQVLDVSPLVRTRAVLALDQEPQPDFWNAIVLVRSGLTPQELLAATSAVESDLGRVRHEHWGPRTLDIDIIQYQGVASSEEELTLPHPRARDRAFVLVPWELVDPGAHLDGAGAVSELAAVAPDRDGVLDAVSDWLEDPGPVAAESDEVLAERESAAVIQTPAGGSVVVPAESHPATHLSRLDLVPEVSRVGLHPSESGGDYLWHRLWEQWEGDGAGGTGAVPEPASTGADRVRENSENLQPSPPVEGTDPGAPRPFGEMDTDGSGAEDQAGAGAGTATGDAAAAHVGGQSSPSSQQAPLTPATERTAGEATAREATAPSPHRPPRMWVPLRAGAVGPDHPAPPPGDRHGEHADPSAAGTGADRERAASPSSAEERPGTSTRGRGTPALPKWDFPSGTGVRIVDDASDLRPAAGDASLDGATERPVSGEVAGEDLEAGDDRQVPDASAQDTPSVEDGHQTPPARRSILRVDLPPGTPEGLLEEDERTQTSLLRGITVRPTVTGQLPLRRSRRSDGEQ
ncbi:MAG: 2-amino-4-hydroxy-6-hydroxymethyldihydropteridine diphosphokinase [Propionibacterium sp.]|nr:2-amino-4-hydroxy-6-hydroxymethyldihydropteridine diphosphokinase [Propionibacterium sp.]